MSGQDLLIIKHADSTERRYFGKLADHLLDEVDHWPELEKAGHVNNEAIELFCSSVGHPPTSQGLRDFIDRVHCRSLGTKYKKPLAQFIISQPPNRPPLTPQQLQRAIQVLLREFDLQDQAHSYTGHKKSRFNQIKYESPLHGHLLVDLLDENSKINPMRFSKLRIIQNVVPRLNEEFGFTSCFKPDLKLKNIPGARREDAATPLNIVTKPIRATFDVTTNLPTFVAALEVQGYDVSVIPRGPEKTALNIHLPGGVVAQVMYRHDAIAQSKAEFQIKFGRYHLPKLGNGRPDSATERQDSRLKISRRALERTVRRGYQLTLTTESFVAALAEHDLVLERGISCLIVVRSKKDDSRHSLKNLLGDYMREQVLIERFGTKFIKSLPLAKTTACKGSKSKRASIARGNVRRAAALASWEKIEHKRETERKTTPPVVYLERKRPPVKYQAAMIPVTDEMFARRSAREEPIPKWDTRSAPTPAIALILEEFEARLAGARDCEVPGLLLERDERIRIAWMKYRDEQKRLAEEESKAVNDAIARRNKNGLDRGLFGV